MLFGRSDADNCRKVLYNVHMTGLPAALAHAFMGLFRKDELIGFPEIAITVASLVGFWRQVASLPETADKSVLFRRLLLWGVLMSVAEAVLAFVFLDLL